VNINKNLLTIKYLLVYNNNHEVNVINKGGTFYGKQGNPDFV
jgi:hypothetical protein